MRTHAFIVGNGLDFSDTDVRFADLLGTTARWLSEAGAHRARLGLHELLVNIRDHAYSGGPGPIDVGMTVTKAGLTVSVTDWGRALGDVDVPETPAVSEWGGYGLSIIEGAFDEVEYRRGIGRNQWTLTMRSEVVAAS